MLQSRLAETRRRRPPDFGLAQVNIVLLLVLFFLVVGTIVETDELAIDLSKTTDLPLERLPRPLLLIPMEGDWSLDGATLSQDEITALLTEREVGRPNAVYILTPSTLPADRLVSALQVLETTGRAVQLVTLKDTGGTP